MANSFDGVAFEVMVEDDYGLIQPAYQVEHTVRHVPGSNINVVHLGGLNVGRIQTRVACFGDVDWAAFVAKLGTTATLVYLDTTYANAVFAALTDIKKFRNASGGDAVFEGQAEFFV